MPAQARAPRQPSRSCGKEPGRHRPRAVTPGPAGDHATPGGTRMLSISRFALRATAAGAAAGLIALGGASAAGAATGPFVPGATSVPNAAAWLVAQLTGPNHDHYNFPGTTFADDGNTADGVLALDAAQVAQTAAARMTAWLESDVANYAGTAPNYYPGSLAKLLIVAEAQHVDVHDFGGVDLVAALLGE